MTEQQAITLTHQMITMIFWMKIVFAIAIVAIIVDFFALSMFISFRRTASDRLVALNKILGDMAEAIDLMRRHGEVAREQKEDTQAALKDIRTETKKGITEAAAVAEKVAATAANAAEVVASKAAAAIVEVAANKMEEIKTLAQSGVPAT